MGEKIRENINKFLSAIARFSNRVVVHLYPHEFTFKRTFFLILPLFILGFFAITIFFYKQIDLNQVRAMKEFRPSLPSKLVDRKGRLITRFFINNRILVDYKNIPPHLTQALIATEDNHFFQHHGIDIQAIFRAFLKNVTSGHVRQGGSTITQQLAKIILTNRERSLTRKIKEAVYAITLDYLFTKEEILSLYFNQIYLGHGNYGVEAASQFYFAKAVKDLRVGESAILAGLANAPNRFSPLRNPHLARLRLAYVLRKMINMNYLTPKQAKEEFVYMDDYIQTLNVAPETSAFGIRKDLAGYFSETVRRMMVKELGEDLLYEGGLTIHSSLDLDHQKIAQEKLWKALERQNEVSRRNLFTKQLEFSKRYGSNIELISQLFDLPQFKQKRRFDDYQMQLYFFEHLADKAELLNLAMGGVKNVDDFFGDVRNLNPYQNQFSSVEGAFIELDHKTGDVTAMVGGTPFTAVNQINRTYQIARQPGSTFKPLLYAAAIELKKITAATIFPDTPLVLKDTDGSSWIPENYSGGFRGFISVREALTNSVNMISISIAREIGLTRLLPIIAKELDVKVEQIPANLSVTLGSYEVNPLQMARAFSIFARGGKSLPPVYVHKVTDSDGNVIRSFEQLNKSKSTKVLSPQTAAIMVDLLKSVVNKGTGKGIRNRGYHGFAAGKTGTTNNFRDAWFVGFNHRYTSAVWVGYDRPTLNLGAGQSGGVVAAPIWAYYQIAAKKFMEKENAVQTAPLVRVELCPVTGKLRSENCPFIVSQDGQEEVYSELFIPGTEPTEVCEEDHEHRLPLQPLIPQSIVEGTTEKTQAETSTEKAPQENFFESDGL